MKANSFLTGIVIAGYLLADRALAAPRLLEDLEPVDLTHTLDADFPFIPVPGVTFPFGLAPIATIEANGVAANKWIVHEHLGTQIDAPNHFARGGAGLHTLEAAQLVVQLAVIDFREHAQRDSDARLTEDDIRKWEGTHGRIPAGAAVVVYTGWDARINDSAAYINADADHVKHYPGISVEAANWLVTQRDIWGVGVDTLSFDPGNDGNYSTHKAVLGAGKFALEAVANLQSVPPVGATLLIGAPKVRDATGGPVRLIALRPKAPAFDSRGVHGGWISKMPERVDRPDGTTVYVDKKFTFDAQSWRILFTVSTDVEGAAKVFSGDFSGSYSIDAYIPLIDAYRARFLFSRRLITVHQPELISALQAAGCGEGKWTAEQGKDVDRTGCAPLRIHSHATCKGEYDIINFSAGELRLGTRPSDANLCTEERRPYRLGGSLVRGPGLIRR